MSHLAFHPLALSQWDRIRLHGSGVVGFKANSGNERADMLEGIPVKVGPSNHGRAKRVAKKFLAGEYPAGFSAEDIAQQEGITANAFRQALYKLAPGPRKAGRPKTA